MPAQPSVPLAPETTPSPPSSPTLPSASPSPVSALGTSSPTLTSARSAAGGRGHRSGASLGGGKLSARALSRSPGESSELDLARDLGVDELRRKSTDELIRLLQSEWLEKDKASLRVAELETTRTSLQQANDHLSLFASRHSREQADAESDRIRLEDELEGKIELVGRLRERVSALEKDKREVDRRYGEQTKSFEAERQALYDNEQHLKARVRVLSTHPATRSSSPVPPQPEPSSAPQDNQVDMAVHQELTRLKRELDSKDVDLRDVGNDLDSLEKGYASLQEAMERSKEELSDLKQVNAKLQEDIESYDLLLTERTFSGSIRSNAVLSRSYTRNGISREDSLNSVDEEEEDDSLTGDDSSRGQGELDPDLVSSDSQPGSPNKGEFDLDPQFADESAGNDDREEGRTLRIKGEEFLVDKGSAKKKTKGESLGAYAVTGSGMDLAAELGRAEVNVAEGQLRRLDKGDDGDALRAEVKSLKEANKALALYTSKILDRILSVDGFENILNTDAGNSLQGSLRRSSGTQRGSPSSRPSLQASTFSPIAPSPSQSKPPPIDTTPKPNVEEKKARRSSIDWRGGFASLFGSTPSSPVVATTPTSQPPSKLRPLSLSSSPLLTSPPRERPVAVSRGSDRRLSTAEETEEEEDRLQKKRIELLQRQLSEEGVESGVSSSPSNAERRRSSGSSFIYRPSMLPSVGTPPQRPNPIDSLVNHFGPSDSSSYFPTLTSPPGLVAGAQVTEDMVASRLRTLDEDERRKASEIGSGKAGGNYSQPSRRASISSRRTSVSSRRTSRQMGSEDGQPSPDERRWLEDGQNSAAHDTVFHYKDE